MGGRTSDLIGEYLNARLHRGELVASSANAIAKVLGQWAHLAPDDPDEWTVDHVAEWVFDHTVRATTSKSRLTKLRPFVRWLIQHDHLHIDPTLALGRIRIPSPAPRDLTIDEVSHLLDACPDDRARLIVLVMVHMGLRSGDLARARVEDIDVRRLRLHVRGKGGRGEPTHWVPIPTEAWATIRSYISARGKVSGPLVRSYQPPHGALTPAHLAKMVTRWMGDAGLEVAPWDGTASHSLRHTCAQHIIDAGGSPYDVQHTLGHASLATTERAYLRHEPPGLRAAIDGRRYVA